MPAACQALEAWAAFASLQAGQPVFRPIDQHGTIGESRLSDRSVSEIVKMRMRRLMHSRGRTKKDARDAVGALQRVQPAGGLRDDGCGSACV